jgi:hypothetical protein
MKPMICGLVLGIALALGCSPTEPQASSATQANARSTVITANTGGTASAIKNGGWGTIKGEIVFDGDKLPENPKLDVTKDPDHCLSKGPLMGEEWVVNPTNKGIRWIVAFLKAEPGKKLPVHENLKAPPADAELDQPCCAFVPHVLAMRDDQKVLIKNPAPVPHSATFKGFNNDFNVTLPSKESKAFEVQAEKSAINVSCAFHPWMKGYCWVFDHPYFAVTDADGKFEIKLAPAGPQKLVIWHETGWVGGPAGRNGREIEVKPDAVTDVGVIKLKPPSR